MILDDTTDDGSRAPLPIWRILCAAMLAVFGVGVIAFQGDVAEISQHNFLTAQTISLVDESLMDNQKTFLVFSAIKASLALIEGSTVGVGLEVQVGDLIQPAYDYVNFFWNVFLFAFVILGFYKVLLETGLLELGFPVMGAGLVLLGIGVLLPKSKWNATLLARRLILLGALMCYVLPISLLGSKALGDRYVVTLKGQHEESIVSFNAQLESTETAFVALKQEISLLNPGDSLDRIQAGLSALMAEVAATFQATLLSFMYYVLIVLFELLVLPFCTAFLLYLVGRRILGGIGTPRVPMVQIQQPAAVAS